jgi:hypothetical protein
MAKKVGFVQSDSIVFNSRSVGIHLCYHVAVCELDHVLIHSGLCLANVSLKVILDPVSMWFVTF